MQSRNALIALLALLLLGGLGWVLLMDDSGPAAASWNEEDVVEMTEEEMAADELEGERGDGSLDRSSFEGSEGGDTTPGLRPMVTIKGRIVNKHGGGIAAAKVNLSAWQRGRRDRISKDVVTGSDGSFALSGKGFSRMFVTLNVKHGEYANASAFKNFNDAKGDLDMGEIKMFVGGTIIGSVTDMQGNVIPNATAELSSMDRGRGFRGGRFGRGGGEQPKVQADNNGIFKIEKVTPGRYRVTATAPHRQRESEGPITVVDEQASNINPIQLGPGFELSGTVFKPDGKPLQGADVSLRGADRRNRTSDVKTNKKGEFAFAHLPPGKYGVRVRAHGYLTNEETQGIEVTETAPLTIHMQTGLRVEGVVTDAVTGRPVTSFGAKIHRVASLPDPEADRKRAEASAIRDQVEQLRALGDKLTEVQKQRMDELSAKARTLGGGRGGFGRNRGRGGDRGGRDRGGRGRGGDRGGRSRGRGGRSWFGGTDRNSKYPGDTGKTEPRPDGRFEFLGLEEGIYVVDIGSQEHQRVRTQRFELRRGQASQPLSITVHRGLEVSGVVLAKAGGKPLQNVDVELRVVLEDDPDRSNGRDGGGRGGRGGRSMFEQFRRGGSGPRTTRLLSARTAMDGSFKIRNAPTGKFVVRAELDGFSTFNTDPFDLKTDATDFAVRLGALGSISGRVTNLRRGQETQTRVMAYASFSRRSLRESDVNPDGTYEITGLEPGNYNVRAFVGDSRGFIFRQMFSRATEQNQTEQFDVKVREGGQHQFNVTLAATTTGTVRGKVMRNGQPATGYRVNLTSLNAPVNTGEENRGRGFMRRFMNSDSVDSEGNFEIKNVEMGDYRLVVTVSTGGRGWGSSGPEVARQNVFVNAEQVTQVPPINLQIGRLVGTVKAPAPKEGEKPQPIGRTTIALYQGVTELPDGEDVLRLSTRTKDAKYEFKSLPVGNYLMLIRASGRDAVTRQVYVGADEKTTLDVEAGPLRQKKSTPTNKAPTKTGK